LDELDDCCDCDCEGRGGGRCSTRALMAAVLRSMAARRAEVDGTVAAVVKAGVSVTSVSSVERTVAGAARTAWTLPAGLGQERARPMASAYARSLPPACARTWACVVGLRPARKCET